MGFPGGTVVKNLHANERDTGDGSSIPVGLGVGWGGGGREKIPWSRKWQLTPVFLPGKSHGQRSLAGYSPWGRKESDMTEPVPACAHVHTHTHTHTHTHGLHSTQ